MSDIPLEKLLFQVIGRDTKGNLFKATPVDFEDEDLAMQAALEALVTTSARNTFVVRVYHAYEKTVDMRKII